LGMNRIYVLVTTVRCGGNRSVTPALGTVRHRSECSGSSVAASL
jgi:hypothetical protein